MLERREPPPPEPEDLDQIEEAINRDEGEDIDSEVTWTELQEALQGLKNGATGPDQINNQMLRNLSEKNQQKLLDLINGIWKNGIIPKKWKEASIVPICKPGKPNDQPESYRPISLTSATCKVMDSEWGWWDARH